jgi:hypothetical protein
MYATGASRSGSDRNLCPNDAHDTGGKSTGEGVVEAARRRCGRLAAVTAMVAASVGLAASTAEAAQRYSPVRGTTGGSALGVAASAGNSYTFFGLTSQFPCRMGDDQRCGQVNVFMSKDMKRVKRLTIGFEAACNSSDHYYGSTWEFDAITPRRSKHNTVATFSGRESQDDPLDGGLTAHDDTALSGKLTWAPRDRARSRRRSPSSISRVRPSTPARPAP